MLFLEDGKYLVQNQNELPNLEGSQNLYLDVETNWNDLPCKHKGDGKADIRDSMPFHGDRICGIAVTADNRKESWYIPVRHRDGRWNLPLNIVVKWLSNTVGTCKDWINHNINFDAHFVKREGVDFGGRLVDTLTLSKLIDSDRFEYGLKPLCREWLGLDMEEEAIIGAYLKSEKSYDFSIVPADIMGKYACQDVIGNRLLYEYIKKQRPEGLAGVWETEIKFTSVLFDIEEFGMPVNETELKIEMVKSIQKSITLETELSQLTGREINPNSNNQIYDLLINHYGLPIVATTDTGGASFDADAMLLYKSNPNVIMNPELKRVIDLLSEASNESHFRSLYLETFLRLQVDGILHPTYNQCVRTGRLSCSTPNAQQQNERSKKLIHPLQNNTIISNDYSQIEFRLIAHYINDQLTIQAYKDNPKTDFHQWVADLCKIGRKPAKNINFEIAFGGGKSKTVSMLTGNEEIVEEMLKKVDEWEKDPSKFEDLGFKDRMSMFKHFCSERAVEVYNTYHEKLPTLKPTAQAAGNKITKRGYVFNAYGRRRNLPNKFKYKAFNAIVQSCASDIMKERMNDIAPRYNSWSRNLGLNFFALVHDEAASMMPTENVTEEILDKIVETFQNTSINFRVPMVMSRAISEKSWGDAK